MLPVQVVSMVETVLPASAWMYWQPAFSRHWAGPAFLGRVFPPHSRLSGVKEAALRHFS
jgi:hypothetical protein